ncbi:MAG: tRNA guanosine(34) transglycosylase Tgt [Bdellovibrionota bacterium]
MSRLNFQLENVAKNSRARAGRFKTLHNEVLTPLFMPVGTHASVRGQRFDCLLESGSQILLANTYHLLLRPGPKVFEKLGGIHGFMKWPKSVLTDSGGFQIFAMPNDRQMSEEGARFLSYVDGKHVHLTPELSISMQRSIGSDIMMVLDQCVPSTVPHKEAEHAMELSNRWALRSLAAREDSPQSMFGIVQGACYQDLRVRSAGFLSQHPFDGYALGGLAVGESKNEREDTVEFAAELLPQNTPRYLMGVGTPIDLLEAVHRGIDMFDCIIPTAHAEQGCAYTWQGKVLLRRGVYKELDAPIDSNCSCSTCRTYSRAYLHHLTKTEEPMGRQLIAAHNIHFYHDLMRTMREAILNNTFEALYKNARQLLAANDADFPVKLAKPKKIKATTLGEYTLENNTNGFTSIKHVDSGEVMHSVIPPEEEAQKLYVDQSRLEERLKEPGEVVIWDIGMGAAANAIAAIRKYEELADKGIALASLRIISFERDLDSLRLANMHLDKFLYLRHGAPNGILLQGEWRSKKHNLSWKLLEGDFFKHFQTAAAPNLLYFDPFSSKTNRDFWCVETLEKIFSRIGANAGEIFTYSASTSVRAAFLAAGFYVAKGVPTGPKGETTIALTNGALAWRKDQLLGQEWLERWERSDARWPLQLNDNKEDKMLERIRQHPQFAGVLQ